MPLSEVPQTAAIRTMNCSPNLTPFMPDQEIVELLWDNGPIVMQGHSNRANKRLFTNTFPSHDVGFQERDGSGRDPIFPKVGHFGATADSMVNDFLHAVPSAHIGLNPQQDDMVTWPNYPINDDSLHTDYCSDFFSELTGVNSNSLSPHHNTVPGERTGGFGLSNRDSHNVEHQHVSKAVEGDSEPSRIRTSQFFQLPQQCQSSAPIPKLRSVEFANGTNSSTHHQGHCGNLQDKFSQNQDPGNSNSKPIPPIGGIGLMNFPHFSRPVSLIKSNLQTVDRLRSHDKASTATSSNPLESMVINSSSGFKSISGIQSKVTLAEGIQSKVTPAEKSEALVQKDTQMNQHVSNSANINTRSPDHVHDQGSSLAAIQEFNKGPEPVVASSSVCSANSAGTESNDIKHTAKRKNREEEAEYRSEGSRDLEDESVSIKKQATGRGMSAKRSRAAEVHNLSERRRRDRINEKMRALQELIPNCNKVDKASMLDEAIEYLKTLQLQVQIMSMGSGLCMPPMMMQHLRPPHMAQFSPMGVNMGMGMGMGLGFGMGMVDMNGSPMVPVPPVHGHHFACPPMSSTGLQMFGIPGQGLNLNSSMPQAPHFNPFPGFSTRPGTLPNPLMVPDAAPSSIPTNKEQQGINQELKNTSTTDFKNQAPSQV